MRTLTSIAIFLIALFGFSAANAFAQKQDKSTSFHELKGKVVDSSGKPVENFSVTISIYDYSEGWKNQKSPRNGKVNSRMANFSLMSTGQFHSTTKPISIEALQRKVFLNEDIPLEFRLLKQIVDDRSLSERLFDWYYFGE